MSSDIATYIYFKGNKDELSAFIRVIYTFETDTTKDANLECTSMRTNEHNLEFIDLEDIDDEEIQGFIDEASGEIIVEGEGPYGRFGSLSEVGLFQALSEAAPTAYFDGSSSGFDDGGDFGLKADLKNGKLYLAEYELWNDELNRRYKEHIKEKMPYTEFCSRFKVDVERFDDKDYIDFLDSVTKAPFYGWPYGTYYSEFKEWCGASEITEEGYRKAIEHLPDLNILDEGDFRQETIKQIARKTVYDPVTKKYKRS